MTCSPSTSLLDMLELPPGPSRARTHLLNALAAHVEAFSRDEYDLVTHYATLSEDGTPQTIRSILANDKYKGGALLQITFTTDFLTKTIKVNDGEVPQYYVTGTHEPIIAPVTWEVVQAELARHSGKGAANTHPFT